MSDTVAVKGLPELMKFFDELPGKVQRNVLRSGMRAGGKVVKIEAQSQLRSHGSVQSGELANGLKVTTSLRGETVIARVVTTGPHAHAGLWVEHGTSAHEIVAKNAQALELDGFAHDVHHPGAKPKPFLRPALDTRAQDAVVAVGRKMQERMTKQGLEGAGDVEVDAA